MTSGPDASDSSLVVAVVNAKGGSGKTTLALHVGVGLARRGPTLLVDADPQRSLTFWTAMAPPRAALPPVAEASRDVVTVLRAARADYRYVVVDCPPTPIRGTVRAIVEVADRVVVPILASPVDLWTSAETFWSLRRLATGDRARRFVGVLNQVEPRSALSASVRRAALALDVPLTAVALGRRVVYRQAAAEGRSVYAMGKRAMAAIEEIEALIQEVV
ncbi:Cobyrinic acid ac-diamide synthase [Acidimicrobium ferrooxidans DSM 10331]|uniref:Cobyrinic acid ac-diamide synthase n=1 Tax=Acidimicrobium ferrooxidans (strain DSM 10331 / JCM 15462 / NBRC 103882 / ICP) TaxID=525909 RepID=C7M200_ACIFD|nr:ParA family protein [Acidimicrobium ferrooxidans]ACU53098.1 Cobyrinic acid ac-diamide synthase [Acidimicrobium ferrooxidans DSM 10331]